MFKNAKVGDRVWDYLCGWGTIIETSNDNRPFYPLRVKFKKKEEEGTYTFDGKRYIDELNQRLFWDEIKFEIPEIPFNLEDELKKLEIKEFQDGTMNDYLVWNNQDNEIARNYMIHFQDPFLICFTEESVSNFITNIKDKKITKEQFFAAYKNVFGKMIK